MHRIVTVPRRLLTQLSQPINCVTNSLTRSSMSSASSSSSTIPPTYSALYLPSFLPSHDALTSLQMSSRDSSTLTANLSANEVIVRVSFASVNPSDVKNSLGFMSSTKLPRVLGRDFTGVVVQIGAGSDAMVGKLVGQEVFGTGGDLGFTVDGSHAEYIRLPSSAVSVKPASLSSLSSSSLGVSFVTASHGLSRGGLTREDIVLVTGANGGVGSAVVQLAKMKGAKVIAVQRSKGAKEPAQNVDSKFGVADATIYLSDLPAGFSDLPAAVRALPLIRSAFSSAPVGDAHHRPGPSLIFDVLGGEVIPKLLETLATKGRLVCIAMPLPAKPLAIDGLELYRQELSIIGVNSLLLSASESAAQLSTLTEGFESGILAARDTSTTSVVTPDQIGQAYRDVIEGKAKGKVIINFTKKAQ